jgi:hypothetical protein
MSFRDLHYTDEPLPLPNHNGRAVVRNDERSIGQGPLQ